MWRNYSWTEKEAIEKWDLNAGLLCEEKLLFQPIRQKKKKDETLISFLPLIKTHLVVFLHTGWKLFTGEDFFSDAKLKGKQNVEHQVVYKYCNHMVL